MKDTLVTRTWDGEQRNWVHISRETLASKWKTTLPDTVPSLRLIRIQRELKDADFWRLELYKFGDALYTRGFLSFQTLSFALEHVAVQMYTCFELYFPIF